MKRNGSLWRLSARGLLIGIATLLLVSGAAAQSKFKTLHGFTDGKGGGWVYAGLIFDSAGNLYGTTALGGAHGNGTVFKLAPNAGGSWTEKVLYSFTGGIDGSSPEAGLIFDAAGNLYGTTASGGTHGWGTVFKLAANGPDGNWTDSVLYSFTGSQDGGSPLAGLIFDPSGNLYGTTFYGGGITTAFEMTPNSDGTWTEKVLHQFKGGTDGSQLGASLIVDQAGNLYGTTVNGGNSKCNGAGCGVVFELTPNGDGSWTESVLHRFTGGKDGGNPFAGLIFDGSGNLYGTGEIGGNLKACNIGCGVVFKLTPKADGSWTESVPHEFAGGKSGDVPSANLIFDQAGNLYGTTYGAGAHGYGTVFKLAPNSNGGWTETVLHSFLDHPGADPVAGLIFDAAGDLYGTTLGDRSTSFGSVFEITP
jgi:uncharacterized repeat protein (TIGR03803 family)